MLIVELWQVVFVCMYVNKCMCVYRSVVLSIITLCYSLFHFAKLKLPIKQQFPIPLSLLPLSPGNHHYFLSLWIWLFIVKNIYIFNFPDIVRTQTKLIKEQNQLLKHDSFGSLRVCISVLNDFCYFRPLKLGQKTKRWTSPLKPRRQKWRPVLWTCQLRISCYGR